MGVWVDVAINDISAEYMFGVGIGIAKEVGKGDGGEGVVVVTVARVDFHTCMTDCSR